ncbi:MAG TPA: hypothetical protein VJT71_04325 [Pyrinomonadaceae bacterium]|nr:hypothetical protein [Pyrinomonadaceae bacterium]
MKAVVALITLLFVTILVCGHLPAASQQSTDLQIVNYSWSKDRINWEGDPFARNESAPSIRDRVTSERRRTTALEERQAREQKADKEKPTAPARYVFNYKLTVQNDGLRAIKEIDWDYIFTDAATGEELGRREFTSVDKIGPGKRKDLSVFISSPPTKRISANTLGKKEHDGVVEHVVIVRILYANGVLWQAR